ncbi:MAG: hypothetical protein MUC69_00860, partial [Gemmatimonadales bacterium]|nr:hypothetical protein [Gemmatimonadales bacterium]
MTTSDHRPHKRALRLAASLAAACWLVGTGCGGGGGTIARDGSLPAEDGGAEGGAEGGRPRDDGGAPADAAGGGDGGALGTITSFALPATPGAPFSSVGSSKHTNMAYCPDNDRLYVS